MTRKAQRDHVVAAALKDLPDGTHAVRRIAETVHQQHRAPGLAGRNELEAAVVGRIERELGDDALRVVAAERERVGFWTGVDPLAQLGEQPVLLLPVRFERFERLGVIAAGFLAQHDSVPCMQLR